MTLIEKAGLIVQLVEFEEMLSKIPIKHREAAVYSMASWYVNQLRILVDGLPGYRHFTTQAVVTGCKSHLKQLNNLG